MLIRSIAVVLLAMLGALAVPTGAAFAASCDLSNPVEADAVAAARAAVESACDCDGERRFYLGCVRRTLQSLTLSEACARHVFQCATRSTCGRVGAVTCCRTNAAGVTRCAVKRDAAACRAPSGGSACVGAYRSCCDACGAGGCVPAPSPTATPEPTPDPSSACCVLGPLCATIPPGLPPSDCTIQGGVVVPGGICSPSDDPDCPVPGACGSCVLPPTPTP